MSLEVLAFTIGLMLAGALPQCLASKLVGLKVGLIFAWLWLAASVVSLWFVDIDPHGYGLFAYLLFWGGWGIGTLLLVRTRNLKAAA